MKEIIVCKHCGKFEYYGEMRWLSGWCGCRSCYKHKVEEIEKKPYAYDDLDGHRPTEDEYIQQQAELER